MAPKIAEQRLSRFIAQASCFTSIAAVVPIHHDRRVAWFNKRPVDLFWRRAYVRHDDSEQSMPKRPAPGRTRANDPEGVRQRVLDAAAASFQMRGYHSTSTHDIMREARVSSGALHHHFRTKKDIGLAVIRERVARAVEQTWIEPVQSAKSATDGVLGAFDQIASSFARRKAVLGCPLNNLAIELSLVDSDFRQAVSKIYDDWREALTQRLGADFENIDANAAATFVVASYSGAVALANASQDPSPLRTCALQLASTMEQWSRRSHH